MEAKKLNTAVIALAIGFIAYACICILVFEKGTVFWVELGFTFVAFALSAYAILRPGDQRFFLNLPLYTIASIYLAVQLIASVIFMAMQAACEPWCYVVSIALLSLYLCILLASRATVHHISHIDENVKQNTAFVKDLILELETLRDEADASQQENINALIDLARYSNLQSCEASREVEEEILSSVNQLDAAVQSNDHDAISNLIKQISTQLKQRDRICKAK